MNRHLRIGQAPSGNAGNSANIVRYIKQDVHPALPCLEVFFVFGDWLLLDVVIWFPGVV